MLNKVPDFLYFLLSFPLWLYSKFVELSYWPTADRMRDYWRVGDYFSTPSPGWGIIGGWDIIKGWDIIRGNTVTGG